MEFNPDSNKHANGTYSSGKSEANDYLTIKLNGRPVQSRKKSGVILDSHLDLHEHIERIFLTNWLTLWNTRKSLLPIYKRFVWPHLDYGDIIYDKPVNESLIKMLEMAQYQPYLATTGAVQGISL